MENQDYEALETHFNSFDASKLRGLVSENSAISYAAYVLDNGVIVHCSISDKRLRLVPTVVTQLRKRGSLGLLIASVMHIFYIFYHKNRYGVGGFWHDPISIENTLNSLGEINVLVSDVYYRFDIVHKIAR